MQTQTLYSKNVEALLYTLGKHYGTLRLNLQRSEEASCGHFILLCLTGRHCTLFTPRSMPEASWGFTIPFHSHSKCLKCSISPQEWEPQAWFPSLGPGLLPGSGSELPWAVLELPQHGVGEGNRTAVPLLPNFISLSSCTCRAGGANWASLTKKMPSMKSQEGNNHPAELCQVWPWGCRSLTWVKFSASSSTDQKDPAAPPIQATKLDSWS